MHVTPDRRFPDIVGILELAAVQHVAATVLCPGRFVMAFVLRLFFAETDRLQLFLAGTEQGSIFLSASARF
jgi:hypothetical protein